MDQESLVFRTVKISFLVHLQDIIHVFEKYHESALMDYNMNHQS